MVPAPWRRFSPLEARCGQEGGRGACGEEERCASPQGHQAGTQGSAVLSHWGTRLGPRGALFFPSTHPWGCQAETEGRVAALSRPEGLVPLHPSSGASQGCAQRTWDPKAGTRQKLRGSQHTGPGWVGSGRRRAAKAPSQAQALQPFAGAVKPLPTESSIAGLAAVQGGCSQS